MHTGDDVFLVSEPGHAPSRVNADVGGLPLASLPFGKQAWMFSTGTCEPLRTRRVNPTIFSHNGGRHDDSEK